MGLFGDVWEAAAGLLGKTGAGAAAGFVVGGPVGAIVGGIVGSNVSDGPGAVNQSGMTPKQLLEAVLSGPGTGSLEEARRVGGEQARNQTQLHDGTRGVMTALESAWTGGAADAARAKLQPLADSSTSASSSLERNSGLTQTQLDQFVSLKNSLDREVAADPPTTGTYDDATPWDTDTEDKVNQYNQKAQANLDRYNAYNDQSSSNTAGRTIDYGQLGAFDGGDFKIDDSRPGPGPGDDGKVRGFDGRSDPGDGGYRPPPGGVQPPLPTGPPPGHETPSPRPYEPPRPHQPSDPGFRPGQYDDGTRAAGYTPPQPSSYPGYQPPSFGPGTGGGTNFGPGGGGGVGFGPGFGPGSGSGGFGPGSGSSGGPGSGATPGAGRGSGAMAPGQPGQVARPGMPGGPAGGAGRPGAPGMGPMGAGAGKGKGGEDEEHQRASYLQEADPESVFGGTDTKPVPPVIGL
ncbi:hypothetical protein [Amycolatopsis sp. WAC 01376]|uniref:hypothetical protein n=1 Tax=Amycolatopsis sp. WAC 01376 TaxID=2203195 RepID=UPI000F79A7B1|nr:hypothetical protein [Amycolatopsis sp. WAC 01376]